MKEIKTEDRLIVALDTGNLTEAERLVEELMEYCSIFKVGAQLFTAQGPEAIRMVQAKGAKVFLDLKYHDIPNTVVKAAEEALKLGVHMFTIHTWGGREMMKRTAQQLVATSLESGLPRPLVFGVTILTSIDQKILFEELLHQVSLKAQVRSLARLAKLAGLDGVVSSPDEIQDIRDTCGEHFYLIVPGIRPKDFPSEDQRRTNTPSWAIYHGADYLVVGRPITQSASPKRVAEKILKEIEDAVKDRLSLKTPP